MTDVASETKADMEAPTDTSRGDTKRSQDEAAPATSLQTASDTLRASRGDVKRSRDEAGPASIPDTTNGDTKEIIKVVETIRGSAVKPDKGRPKVMYSLTYGEVKFRDASRNYRYLTIQTSYGMSGPDASTGRAVSDFGIGRFYWNNSMVCRDGRFIMGRTVGRPIACSYENGHMVWNNFTPMPHDSLVVRFTDCETKKMCDASDSDSDCDAKQRKRVVQKIYNKRVIVHETGKVKPSFYKGFTEAIYGALFGLVVAGVTATRVKTALTSAHTS